MSESEKTAAKVGAGQTPAAKPEAPKPEAPKPHPVQPPAPLGVEHQTHPRQKLSQEKLETMSKAEVRAVAADRGYDIGRDGGRGATVARFLAAQEKDSGFASAKEVDEHAEGQARA